MRTLYYIPIVHSDADMGTLMETVNRSKISTLGRQGMARSKEQIARLWNEIKHAVDTISVTDGTLRVYQDGLPVCAQLEQIVAELTDAGSPNYTILADLRARGATLMGTESPEFLVQEYQLAQARLKAASGRGSISPRPSQQAKQRAESDVLLKQRDRFIAERINGTLQEGETGILFLGLFHSVEAHLAPDIQLLFPVGRKTSDRTSC